MISLNYHTVFILLSQLGYKIYDGKDENSFLGEWVQSGKVDPIGYEVNIRELMKDYTKNFFHILSLRYTARVKASRISFYLFLSHRLVNF